MKLPKEILDRVIRSQLADEEWKRNFGSVRQIVTFKHNDNRLVAVGPEIHASRHWKTFTEFLLEYIWLISDKEWQIRAREEHGESRHPIFLLHDSVKAFDKKAPRSADGFYLGPGCGAMNAFVHLSYDLYTLRHHSSLQRTVLDRLTRFRGQYQGARYELFVAACMVRAGFNLEFEDDADLTRKHLEFDAVDKVSGIRIGVEAKSKQRHGILGFQAKEGRFNSKPGLQSLVKSIHLKDISQPTIGFIDINLPPLDDLQDMFEHRYREALDEIEGVRNKHGDSVALYIVTNCGSVHCLDDERYFKVEACVSRPEQSAFPIPVDVQERVMESIMQANRIPYDFPTDDN